MESLDLAEYSIQTESILNIPCILYTINYGSWAPTCLVVNMEHNAWIPYNSHFLYLLKKIL
jgi:hypothetical protein